ncbi:MAG: hypothetical protein JRI68_30095, partial [Deltaproteobacteria bacterium]|nr:hypothetical protein [Deltaproteobacteria bacterium]
MRGSLTDRVRNETVCWRAHRWRGAVGAGALLLAGSLVACVTEDDLANQCLDGGTGMCQRLCAAGRRGEGGCLTLAAGLLESDRPRARAMLLAACDAKHPEVCEQAYELLRNPKNRADRETGRELSTRQCEGRARSDKPDPTLDGRRFTWHRDPCLRAADLWLLDDPQRAGALLERVCATMPAKQVAQCFKDARAIAGEIGPSAASCRGGDAEGCARFLDGFLVLRPHVPSQTPRAPWDTPGPYPMPKRKHDLGARWSWSLDHAQILAGGEICRIRGLAHESLWPPSGSMFHDGPRLTDYCLEDVPKLCCGFRAYFMRTLQRYSIRNWATTAVPSDHATNQAFILARSTVEAGPAT